MSNILARIAILVGADSTELRTDLDKSGRHVETFASRMESRVKAMNQAVGVAFLATAAASGALVAKSINAADAIQDLSNRIGVNVKSLSELKFAAEQSGVSYESLTRGLTTVSKNAVGAAGGNAKLAASFDAVRVSVHDSSGNIKSADVLLADVAERFSQLKDGPEKTALALRLFGKSGSELVPLLNEGKKGLAAFATEADRLGVSLNAAFAKDAADFKDNLDKVKTASEGLGNAMAEALLPGLNSGALAFTDLLVGAKDVVRALPQVAAGVIGEFDKIRISAVEKFEQLGNGAGIVWNEIKSGVQILGAEIEIIFGSALDAVQRRFATIPETIGDFAVSVGLEDVGVSLGEFSQALARNADREKALRGEMAQTTAQIALRRQALVDEGAEIAANAEKERLKVDELVRSFDATSQNTGAVKAGTEEGRRAAPVIQAMADANKDLAEKTREATGAVEEYRAYLKDLKTAFVQIQRGLDPLIALQDEYTEQLQVLAEIEAREPQRVREVAAAREQLTARYREGREELERRRQSVEALQVAQLTDIRLAGLSGEARDREVRALRAAEDARRAISDAQRAGRTFTDAEIAQIERTSVALAERAHQVEQNTARLDDASREASDALGDLATTAVTDFRNIGEAWDDTLSSFGDMAKRAISQVFSEFARLKLLNPLLNNLFGTSLQTGGGNVLGSIFGGQGGGTGGFSSLLSNLFSTGPQAAPAGFVGPMPQATTGFGAGLFGSNAGGFGSMLGNVGGLVGGLYGVYGAYRSGSVGSGALSGAAAGTAVFPGIGTVIGAVVGALAGLLGGPKTPDLRLGGVGVTRKPEGTFTTELGTFQYGARGIEGAEKDFVKLVEQFDAQMAGIVGSFTNGSEQLAEVRAALARFAVDLKGDAITAENLLGQRFAAILATFDEDVRDFVGSTGKVEERAARLADAAMIVAGVESGFADTFDELAGILQANQVDGEALGATFQRVASSFALMDGVVQGLGLTTNLARTEFIKFSSDVVLALGGIENAGGLLNRNLSTYLSTDEQRQIRLTSARGRLTSAAEAAGIEGDLSNEAFRELLNQALAGAFDADKTAAILRYGAALADVNEIVAEGAATQPAPPQATVVDLQPFQDAVASVYATLADFGRTDYQRQLEAVRTQFRATNAELLRLGREAGDTTVTLAASSAAFETFVLQQNQLLQGLRRTVLRTLIDLYGGDNKQPAREFGSELDLLQNGFRNASQETQDWAAQLEKLERMEAASTLAQNLRNLFEDGGEGVVAGLAAYKVPLDKLLTDLGVSFDSLTSPESVAAFGRAARLLGLTAEELADIADIDLSGLSQADRDKINAGAAAKPNAQKEVTDGLGKVATAADGTTDAVEAGTAEVAGLLRQLLRLMTASKGPAFDPFAAAGVPG